MPSLHFEIGEELLTVQCLELTRVHYWLELCSIKAHKCCPSSNLRPYKPALQPDVVSDTWLPVCTNSSMWSPKCFLWMVCYVSYSNSALHLVLKFAQSELLLWSLFLSEKPVWQTVRFLGKVALQQGGKHYELSAMPWGGLMWYSVREGLISLRQFGIYQKPVSFTSDQDQSIKTFWGWAADLLLGSLPRINPLYLSLRRFTSWSCAAHTCEKKNRGWIVWGVWGGLGDGLGIKTQTPDGAFSMWHHRPHCPWCNPWCMAIKIRKSWSLPAWLMKL